MGAVADDDCERREPEQEDGSRRRDVAGELPRDERRGRERGDEEDDDEEPVDEEAEEAAGRELESGAAEHPLEAGGAQRLVDAQRIDDLLDDPADAEMTLRALRRNNLANRVHWVRDGAEALDFMFRSGRYVDRDRNHAPKLIMLDIKMPKVDGIEVLKRLKADETTRAVPVVVMTSSNEEQDVMESYRLGVNSYIVKPVQFDAFLETVAKIGLYWVLTNRAP